MLTNASLKKLKAQFPSYLFSMDRSCDEYVIVYFPLLNDQHNISAIDCLWVNLQRETEDGTYEVEPVAEYYKTMMFGVDISFVNLSNDSPTTIIKHYNAKIKGFPHKDIEIVQHGETIRAFTTINDKRCRLYRMNIEMEFVYGFPYIHFAHVVGASPQNCGCVQTIKIDRHLMPSLFQNNIMKTFGSHKTQSCKF